MNGHTTRQIDLDLSIEDHWDHGEGNVGTRCMPQAPTTWRFLDGHYQLFEPHPLQVREQLRPPYRRVRPMALLLDALVPFPSREITRNRNIPSVEPHENGTNEVCRNNNLGKAGEILDISDRTLAQCDEKKFLSQRS